MTTVIDREFEKHRRDALIAAEKRAESLFDAIEQAGLIRPNRTEREVEDEIYALATAQFGIEKHWHKRIVRTGRNTLTVAADTPPIRSIEADDIVYVDLGPVFDEWEADIGRSYVLGSDPEKRRLVSDLTPVFTEVQAHYWRSPEMTGADLYRAAQHAAAERGWSFGGATAGHLVSEFAHAHIPGDKHLNRIGPANVKPMRAPDDLGRVRHWILEIHLVDHVREIGGFYERLL